MHAIRLIYTCHPLNLFVLTNLVFLTGHRPLILLISFSLHTLAPIAPLALYIYILSFLDICHIIELLFIIATVISSPPPQH